MIAGDKRADTPSMENLGGKRGGVRCGVTLRQGEDPGVKLAGWRVVLSGERSEDSGSDDKPSAKFTCGVVLALRHPEREVGELGEGDEGCNETGCRESAGL